MTNRLTIHFPNSTMTFETDDVNKLIALSDFCKKELDGYRSTEDLHDLTIDKLSEDGSNRFNSKLSELGLI